MAPTVRALDELVAALRSPYAAEDLLPDAGPPLLVVDLTGRRVDATEVATLRALPAVGVAVSDDPTATDGTGLDAFDLLLSDRAAPGAGPRWTSPERGIDAALAALSTRVEANPQSSVTAVQLLRLSAGLDVVGGLVAESLAYASLQAGAEFRHWLEGRPPHRAVQLHPVPLLAERHDDELRLAFNRPEIHNAYGHEVRDALVEALQLAAADDTVTSVVLAGRGPSFCSGGDLREFGTFADPAAAHLVRTTRSAGYWLHRLADRVRVEVHGACIGAGVELPAFAGRVVAGEDAVFALPELAMGLVPGAGGTVSLPRRIGRHRTAWLCLSGARLDAPCALRWGLVDAIAG